MPNEIDLSTEALLKHRAIAERATPGPWKQIIRPSEFEDNSFFDCVKIGGGDFPTALYYPDEDGHIGDTHVQDMKDSDGANIAANSPEVVKAHIDEILRLRAEAERLNEEADYLAGVIASAYCAQENVTHCEKTEGLPLLKLRDTCASCWREAARNAVEASHAE